MILLNYEDFMSKPHVLFISVRRSSKASPCLESSVARRRLAELLAQIDVPSTPLPAVYSTVYQTVYP
jgi:hypothetical protein